MENNSAQTWLPLQIQHHQGRGQALKELRQDNDRVILTVDKGVAMVVLESRTIYTKPRTS